jgi:hypothetical protein
LIENLSFCSGRKLISERLPRAIPVGLAFSNVQSVRLHTVSLPSHPDGEILDLKTNAVEPIFELSGQLVMVFHPSGTCPTWQSSYAAREPLHGARPSRTPDATSDDVWQWPATISDDLSASAGPAASAACGACNDLAYNHYCVENGAAPIHCPL